MAQRHALVLIQEYSILVFWEWSSVETLNCEEDMMYKDNNLNNNLQLL